MEKHVMKILSPVLCPLVIHCGLTVSIYKIPQLLLSSPPQRTIFPGSSNCFFPYPFRYGDVQRSPLWLTWGQIVGFLTHTFVLSPLTRLTPIYPVECTISCQDHDWYHGQQGYENNIKKRIKSGNGPITLERNIKESEKYGWTTRSGGQMIEP